MRLRFTFGPVLSNLVASASLQLTVAALSLISGPMQARGLGSEGRGQLAVVLIIGQIASMAVDMGTGGYIIRERANGMSRNDLIGSILPIMCLSVLGGMLLSWPIAHIFSGGSRLLGDMIIAQMMLMPIVAFVQIGSSVALGEERMRMVIAIRLATAIVPVIGITLLFIINKLTLLTACICYFSATFFSTLPAMKIWLRSLPLKRNTNTTRAAWRFGRSSMLTMILSLGNVRADTLIVAKALSFHDAGLYVVASTLAGLPMMLANAAMQSLARRLSLNNLGQATARATSLVSSAVILTAVIVAAVSPVILPLLFGAEFVRSVPIAWVLLAGTIFGANANFLGIATTLANKPKVAAFAQFAGLVTMVMAMLILSRYEGVLGAAVGSSLGYVVTLVVLIRHAQKTSNMRWYTYVIPSSDAIAMVIRHAKGQ